MMELHDLPDDVLSLVLHRFSFLERARCLQLVNKRWRRLCQASELLAELDLAQVQPSHDELCSLSLSLTLCF